jgi:hypothetical protein
MLWELQLTLQLIREWSPLSSRVIVYRKPALVIFAWGGIVTLTVGFTVAAFLPRPSTGSFFAAVVSTLLVYCIWLVGWHSAVHMERDEVTVDNLLVRHVIPRSELADIGVGNGLVFRLRDGRRIGSVMFGGSVIGAILGYRYTRRVAARMTAAWDDMGAGSPERGVVGTSYRRLTGFSPWPPLAIWVVMESIASISVLVK